MLDNTPCGVISFSNISARNVYGDLNSLFSTFGVLAANRPFPSCFEPHYESEAKCKVFIMKISFHSHANKTNFHVKSFALSLAFIMRFTTTRKWPIRYHTNIFIRTCILLEISVVDSSSPNFHWASLTLEIIKNTTVRPAHSTVTTIKNSKR